MVTSAAATACSEPGTGCNGGVQNQAYGGVESHKHLPVSADKELASHDGRLVWIIERLGVLVG
jgi:hypothetical protein